MNKRLLFFLGFLSGIIFSCILIISLNRKTANVLGSVPLPSPSPSISCSPSPSPLPSPSPSSSPSPSPSPQVSPSPSPSPRIYPTSQELESLFSKYGAEFGVDLNVLRQLASCESGFNTYALNGPYAGLYQFNPHTWQVTRKRMTLDPDLQLRFNFEEAIKTSAFKISRDGLSAWPNCKLKL